MKFDWKAAERDFLRALELGPEVWDVWMQYSIWYLKPMRRLDEAVVAMQKALDLDPLSPLLHYNLGMAYFEMRQYDQAIEQFRNTLELDPHYFWTHEFLGISYIQIGRSDEGTRAIEAAAQLKDHPALARGLLGFACSRADRIGETQKMLAELHEQAQNEYVPALAFACIYQGLGEIDKAFDWLEKAVDEFSALFLELHGGPIFDTLRSHPRYKALLRKMNLDPRFLFINPPPL